MPLCLLIEQEEGAIARMNADHEGAMRHCCRYFRSCEAMVVKLFGVGRDRIGVHASMEVPRMTFS